MINVFDNGATRPAAANEIAEIQALQQAAANAALPNAQAAQIALLNSAYSNAIGQNVAYTSKAGIADTYQADPESVQNMVYMLNAYAGAQTLPSGFWWRSATNQNNAFTYADLQALAAAAANRGWAAFQHLQAQKTAVMAATTVQQVQSIDW